MGKVETPRHRSKAVTIVAVLVLAYSGIATILFFFGSLSLAFLEQRPNPTLEAWLRNPATQPGLVTRVLMEFPLIPTLILFALFVTLTLASIGTIRRRNRDRQLMCIGLLTFIAMRGFNVYLAVATNLKPVTASDEWDVVASFIDVVLFAAAFAFFSWKRVVAEFDDSRLVFIDQIRNTARLAAAGLRPIPGARRASAPTKRARPSDMAFPMMQFGLVLVFILFLVVSASMKAPLFLLVAGAYALIIVLTYLNDHVTSTLLTVSLSTIAVIILIPTVVFLELSDTPGLPRGAAITYAVLSVLLIPLGAVSFWSRSRARIRKPLTPTHHVDRNALLVSAVGRTILVLAALMVVTSAPITIASVMQQTYGGVSAITRLTALATFSFWVLLAYGAIAFLQRRWIGLRILAVEIIAAVAILTVKTLSSIAYVLQQQRQYRWFVINEAYAPVVLMILAAASVLVFMRSRVVRAEFDPSVLRAPVSPPRTSDSGVRNALRVFAVFSVLVLVMGFFGKLVGSAFMTTGLWKHLRAVPFVLAAAVGVWTVFAPGARSAEPRRAGDLVLALRLGGIAIVVLTFLQVVSSFTSVRWNLGALVWLVWPALLTALLWLQPTRMIGVAICGALFIVWFPNLVRGSVLYPLGMFGYADADWLAVLHILSSLVWVMISICGFIAARRTFVSYAGPLPRDVIA